MDYKIIQKEAFNFVGVSKRISLQFEGVNNEIVELAQSISKEQKKEMHELQNIEPREIVNVSYNSNTNFLKLKENDAYSEVLISFKLNIKVMFKFI